MYLITTNRLGIKKGKEFSIFQAAEPINKKTKFGECKKLQNLQKGTPHDCSRKHNTPVPFGTFPNLIVCSTFWSKQNHKMPRKLYKKTRKCIFWENRQAEKAENAWQNLF